MPLDLSTLETAIRDERFHRLTSVVVAQRGAMTYEGYFDGGGAEARRNTRSVTKTVAGMLIGMAIDRGAITGVDAPLLSFFGDLEPMANDSAAKRGVTLHDILTMSSDLDCDDGDPSSPGNEEGMYESPDWLRFALDLPAREDGDGSFRYCTAGVTTLAGVLERATGERLDAYADEHLFAPLGITDASWFRSPTGLVQTGGGLELRSRDLLALGQLYLDGGAIRGRQVVPEDWVRTSLHPHLAVDSDTAYGYLWWLRRLRIGARTLAAPMMQGNGGSKVVILLDLGAVVVITSTNYSTPGMHEQTDRILIDHVLPAIA